MASAPNFLRLILFSLALNAFCVSAHATRGAAPKPIQPRPPEVEAPEVPGLPTTMDDRAPASAAATAPSPAAKPQADEAPKGGQVVSSITRVVGEVGEQFITSREVQINDIIEQAVFGRLPGRTEIRVLRGNEKSFPSDVQNVLREWVVYLEARSFDSAEVSKADLLKAVKTVQENTVGLASWQSLEPSNLEISEILERKLVSKKFLRLKTDSAQVPITDAEALAYYKKNRLKFGNLPFASFRENIKTFLIKQQMDRRLQDWIEVLERKYKVRNFIAG